MASAMRTPTAMATRVESTFPMVKPVMKTVTACQDIAKTDSAAMAETAAADHKTALQAIQDQLSVLKPQHAKVHAETKSAQTINAPR